MGLGLLLLERDLPERAESLFRESLEIYKRKLDTADVRIAGAYRALGRSLTVQRRYAEAEAALKQSLNLLPEGIPERDERAKTLRSLIGLYEASSRRGKVASYQALMHCSTGSFGSAFSAVGALPRANSPTGRAPRSRPPCKRFFMTCTSMIVGDGGVGGLQRRSSVDVGSPLPFG